MAAWWLFPRHMQTLWMKPTPQALAMAVLIQVHLGHARTMGTATMALTYVTRMEIKCT